MGRPVEFSSKYPPEIPCSEDSKIVRNPMAFLDLRLLADMGKAERCEVAMWEKEKVGGHQKEVGSHRWDRVQQTGDFRSPFFAPLR